MSKLISRPPVASAILDYSSNNVTTSAWVTVVAVASQPSNGLEVFNGSGSVIMIAKGSAGNEVAIPYYILPGGSSIFLPLEFAKGVRISVKAADVTAANGTLALNFFG